MNENMFAQTAKMGTNIVPNFLQVLVKILLKICNNNNQTIFSMCLIFAIAFSLLHLSWNLPIVNL